MNDADRVGQTIGCRTIVGIDGVRGATVLFRVRCACGLEQANMTIRHLIRNERCRGCAMRSVAPSKRETLVKRDKVTLATARRLAQAWKNDDPVHELLDELVSVVTP